MKKVVILLFALIILATAVNALDIIISIPRTDYQAGETIQAEVFLSDISTQDLTLSNFEFLNENNEKIQVALFLEKLSNTHYFVYFNTPTNIQKGNYKFKVKNVNYISENILKQTSAEEPFYIDSVNPGFSYLSQQQNPDGGFQDTQTTALASLALKNIYPDKSQQAINYLVQNQDPTGCYPEGNCNVKDTAFALLALDEFNQNIIKTKNWLKDASNNFGLGTWSLIISSTNAVCVLNNQNITITQQQSYIILSESISLECNQNVTLTLNHSYLGNTYQIFTETTSSKQYTIDNSGCYGSTYKSNCDYEITGYAVWVLSQLNENPSTEYLENNHSDTQTLDHALLYLIINNQYSFDWLLNNLQNNYWSSQSASLNQNPDNYISAFAAYAIREDVNYEGIKSYLYDKTTTNPLTSALILYLHFNDELLQPSLSITPGIINQQDPFILTLTNNKDPITVEIIAPNFTSLPTSLLLINTQTFVVNPPENTQSFNIEIKYSNLSYLIPVLTSYENGTSNLLPPPINAISILNFPVLINQTLNPDDKTEDIIEFYNSWGFPLYNISFVLTGTLGGIITLEQTNFDVIQAKETLTQKVITNKNRNPELEDYSGYLIITSQQGTISSVGFNLHFTVDQPPLPEQEEDLNETLEEEPDNNEEPNDEEEEEKSSPWLWLIPFFIILIIGILIFFLKGKKIKTQTFDQYLQNIKK